jgi:transposase
MLQEIRRMRFEAILDRHEAGELSQIEAAEMLGISERSLRRWRDRLREEGPEGLKDRRLGKPSSRRAPAEEIVRMLGLYQAHYADFTVKHFHDQLKQRHNYTLGYTLTKRCLHRAGLVVPAPRRSAHRKKRPRRPMIGMLLHQDGSRHLWVPGMDRMLDLIVTLDDADSRIYSAFLVEEENTASSFRGLSEVIARHGLFCQLYTDRGGHYFFTPKGSDQVSRGHTQVGRALKQLGIEHIAAYSPEARGRSERAFRTLQDRLPKELKLAGITTIAAANRFLAETFIPDYNARFAIVPEQPGSAFVPVTNQAWREILCVQEERIVGNDNTVRWRKLVLQIPPNPLRRHFVRARIRIHEYPDGRLAAFLGPHRLADYDAAGCLLARAVAGRLTRFGGRPPVDKAGALPTGATTTEAVN